MRARARRVPALSALLAAAVALGCDHASPTDGGPPDAGGPVAPRADYGGGLWDAPWPDERLRRADGTIDISGFANPRGVRLVEQLRGLLADAPGFAVSSTLFFPLTGALDPSSLPSPHESLEEDAALFLVDVDAESPGYGARQPLVARFDADPGPFGAPNLLALLPLQGRPLQPGRLYAAVLTTRLRTARGEALVPAAATESLRRGERPDGMGDAAFDAHTRALAALRDLGVAEGEIAAMAVFRTWDPTAELAAARDEVVGAPLPALDGPLEAREVFDDYCVFHGTIRMPVFQAGEAPYTSEGGGWARDASGALVLTAEATSNVWITVPRRAMPAEGFPAGVFIRTGGGGDRPLVDRGPHAVAGGEAEPGTGPATHFARAGVLGVSVDGPLGGLRNLDGWDEQFAIFNINNPEALRDSIRQSALELMLFAHVLPSVRVDASSCAGLSTPAGDGVVSIDADHVALMGHSMGATIAPLAVALEPRYAAMILSGAGASWIENVVFKQSPIHVRPAADALLRYTGTGRTITEHDPVLALLQWAGEPADPQVYARMIVEEPASAPRHVLMFQGILDTYIPPPVANALSLALGLDLGGEALDATLAGYAPLADFLDLSGRGRVSLPASGNLGAVTAVVVQHLEDGIEDGHEVVFQTAAPQLQYRCFLESLRAGAPRVPAAGAGCE